MAFIPPPAQKSLLDRPRLFSPTASIKVSPLCLGTMNFGEAWKDHMGECSKENSFQILDHYFSQGGNFIDTANAYQGEESEIWLGEWMASRQNRDEIVLATKYTAPFPYHHREKIQVNFGGNGTKSLRLSLEASLKKLQTTYVDIFYVHWWDFTVSIPELMRTLNDLAAAGKILHLGISDSPAWIVSKANEYARCHGLRQFVVYQGLWNAGIRDFERDILPMCRAEGMALVPYGTLGQGRFQTQAGFQEREKNNPGRTGPPINEHDKAVSRALEKIANAKGTDITSVALAYIRSKAPYVFPLVGGRKVEHLKGNIAALNISVSQDEVKEIENAYHFDHGFPHTFLSGSRFGAGTPRGAFGPEDIFLSNQMGHFDYVQAEKSIDSQ